MVSTTSCCGDFSSLVSIMTSECPETAGKRAARTVRKPRFGSQANVSGWDAKERAAASGEAIAQGAVSGARDAPPGHSARGEAKPPARRWELRAGDRATREACDGCSSDSP